MPRPLNKYRFVWRHPDAEEPSYGAYLFNSAEEASGPMDTLKTMFPNFEIWMEDDQHNKIEIPGDK